MNGKTFEIKFGLYEWLLMPFGLTNAPSTPMRLIYNVLEKYLKKHVVYIDDIIIYLKILLEHVEHVTLVLITHKKEKFNFNKCSFCMEKVLGFIVGKNIVEVGKNRVEEDKKRINVIRDLLTPKSASKIRSIYGLASFYKRFINDFSTITAILNNLVKNNIFFKWGEMQENASNFLRKKLSKPLLVLASFDKTIEIECDVRGLGISIVLIQDGKHLIYFSEKLNEQH